jgi:hypothetical protein
MTHVRVCNASTIGIAGERRARKQRGEGEERRSGGRGDGSKKRFLVGSGALPANTEKCVPKSLAKPPPPTTSRKPSRSMSAMNTEVGPLRTTDTLPGVKVSEELSLENHTNLGGYTQPAHTASGQQEQKQQRVWWPGCRRQAQWNAHPDRGAHCKKRCRRPQRTEQRGAQRAPPSRSCARGHKKVLDSRWKRTHTPQTRLAHNPPRDPHRLSP